MEWHYATSAGRRGPVTADMLFQLCQQGVTNRQTLVWRPGMKNWTPMTECAEFAGTNLGNDMPPPLSGEAMSNGIIWALALAPIWGYLVQMFATELRVFITGEMFVLYRQMWPVMLGINICLMAFDNRALRLAGHDTRRIKWWMALIVPVYIYQRDRIIGADLQRFIAWMVCFTASIYMFGW